ncbi:MAG: CDP-diacylglycerol--glycerol-3-phosphate 3-phosphatidyltransferase [Candidatus Omnitrophota bacterium]
MNLPNKITISRIGLAFLFMFFLFSKGLSARYLAFFTFLLASFTDLIDGKLARRRNEITTFGKLVDPIADKILVLAAFLGFVELRLVPAWMVVLIIVRELIITGLRLTAANKGIIIEASRGAKHKTVSQMSAIFLILGVLAIKETLLRYTTLWTGEYEKCFNLSVLIIMSVTVLFTLGSGITYLIKNKRLFLK